MKTLKPEEVFEYLPNTVKYIAMDEDKDWFTYTDIPTQYPNRWEGNGPGQLILNIDYDGDWEHSLFERPKSLDEKDELIKQQKDEIRKLWERVVKQREDITDLNNTITTLHKVIDHYATTLYERYNAA